MFLFSIVSEILHECNAIFTKREKFGMFHRKKQVRPPRDAHLFAYYNYRKISRYLSEYKG